jgi:hypothetical protein
MAVYEEEGKGQYVRLVNVWASSAGRRIVPALVFLLSFCPGEAAAQQPSCLRLQPDYTPQSVLESSGVGEEELLARLVYAETASTGFPDDPLVYEAIAWGVMNRVRLGDASPSMQRAYGKGIRGVVFKKGQFNPAVSGKSRFSREFLCPAEETRWAMALNGARKAMDGSHNPFLATEWERRHGISLVVNFYYPGSVQAKGPLAPWEKSRGLVFVGNVRMGEGLLGAEKVRFYRLTRAPKDIPGQAPRDF